MFSRTLSNELLLLNFISAKFVPNSIGSDSFFASKMFLYGTRSMTTAISPGFLCSRS